MSMDLLEIRSQFLKHRQLVSFGMCLGIWGIQQYCSILRLSGVTAESGLVGSPQAQQTALSASVWASELSLQGWIHFPWVNLHNVYFYIWVSFLIGHLQTGMDTVHLTYSRCLHWDEMSPVPSSATKNISENSVIGIFTADTLALCSALKKNLEGHLLT